MATHGGLTHCDGNHVINIAQTLHTGDFSRRAMHDLRRYGGHMMFISKDKECILQYHVKKRISGGEDYRCCHFLNLQTDRLTVLFADGGSVARNPARCP